MIKTKNGYHELGGGIAEHMIKFFGDGFDKAITINYLLQATDERIEKAIPIIAKEAANIVLANIDVMVIDKAKPQLDKINKEIEKILTPK